MKDKIALVTCGGLSPLGLIVRVATVDLALENKNIVVSCLTSSLANPLDSKPITENCPVVAITGCEDDCVSKILKNQDIKTDRTIDTERILSENNLDPKGINELDADGKIAVKKLKEYILKELENL